MAKLVFLTWRDAHFLWDDRPEGDFHLYSVGWLIKRGKRWTTIAAERNEDGAYRCFTRIPTSEVTSIRRLRRSR